jgi:osmotically-inducible protein OsmY
MMKKFCLVFLIVLCFAPNAFSWGEVGHKISAYIAWERLTPEVREKVFKLLLAAPEDSDLNVMYDAYNSRSEAVKRRELFMFASIWPDFVRNRDFAVRYKNYHQGDWHYADIFWKQENGRAVILENFPEESGKAVPKLAELEKILAGASYKPAEKAVALAWFLHIGGDLHNPLHNASRVTETEPKGDQGGNLFVLRKRTEADYGLNLHSFWDGIIDRVEPRRNDACDTDYIKPIAEKLMKKYPSGKMAERLKPGAYKDWNAESFAFLNGVVYNGIEREQMPSKKYQKRAYETSAEQIALAGYRLGATLNRIFGGTSEAAEKKEINSADAIAVWEKVKAVIDNDRNFKYIRVEIDGSTVTLKGIIANADLKRKAAEEVKKIAGVETVVNLLEVDESIAA